MVRAMQDKDIGLPAAVLSRFGTVRRLEIMRFLPVGREASATFVDKVQSVPRMGGA